MPFKFQFRLTWFALACVCQLVLLLQLYYILTNICDAVHEKIPNGQNGVISMVVQRTYQGIKQNQNHSKIPGTFQDIEFLLKKF